MDLVWVITGQAVQGHNGEGRRHLHDLPSQYEQVVGTTSSAARHICQLLYCLRRFPPWCYPQFAQQDRLQRLVHGRPCATSTRSACTASRQQALAPAENLDSPKLLSYCGSCQRQSMRWSACCEAGGTLIESCCHLSVCACRGVVASALDFGKVTPCYLCKHELLPMETLLQQHPCQHELMSFSDAQQS